ncbi:MAG TPA: hypothetical protein VGF94_04175 [Kofleriaceae bacterium]|jgi:hypothetical protein
MHRLALVSLVLAAAPAFADDAKQQAAQLFEEGRTLDKDGKYAEACEKLAQSFALDAAPGTELNLGDCHEHLGHLAEAWHRFDHAAIQFEAVKDERTKYARDRRAALEPKLGIVVVEHADAPVTIAGRAQPAGPEIREHVDPGSVEVRIGGDTRHVDVAAGKTAVVDAAPPVVSAPPLTGAPALTDSGPGSRDHQRVLLAYGAAGLGIVGIGTAGVLGLVARGDYHDALDSGACSHDAAGKLVCSSDGTTKVNHSITLANVATGFGVAGIALGAAGVVLYFTAPRERSITVAPNVSSTMGGLTVSGSF